MFALLAIPTMISIFLAIEVNEITDATPQSRLICLTDDHCAMEVGGIWYRINGVIDMEDLIPDEYKIDHQSELPQPLSDLPVDN